MLGLNKIGLDLRIGSKLGITSGIGVLLLAGIVLGQMFGNGQIKDSTEFFLRNNNNRLVGVYMRSATRAMQIMSNARPSSRERSSRSTLLYLNLCPTSRGILAKTFSILRGLTFFPYLVKSSR